MHFSCLNICLFIEKNVFIKINFVILPQNKILWDKFSNYFALCNG